MLYFYGIKINLRTIRKRKEGKKEKEDSDRKMVSKITRRRLLGTRSIRYRNFRNNRFLIYYPMNKRTIAFSFSIDDATVSCHFFVTIATKSRIDRYRSIHIYIYIVWISHQEQPDITQFASKNRWWINDEPSWLLFLSYRTLSAESRRVVCVSVKVLFLTCIGFRSRW